MDAIQLLLLSVLLYSVGALFALLFSGSARLARWMAGGFGLIASLAGILSAATALISSQPPALALFHISPFGALVLRMDALSAFLVGLIALVGVAASLYSLSSGPGLGVIGFFTGIFLAAMLLVVTVSNGFFFLLFWELMTLVSYFLVIWETQKKESIRTGYIYMLVAHFGAVLIMVAFLLFFQKANSFDFTSFRQAYLTPDLKNVIFLLTFIGFGAKAGMVPLHFWTPGAYAAAPDHASALMAGVMKKVAIYGMLRVCADLLGAPTWWWGFTLLVFGALSTLIGAFYALTERDIKRLLAYSSVENVGIILMGAGVGMVGLAYQLPTLAVLGFLATLYHMLNHAFFKGLLYLGAGATSDQVATRDLNRMGGLARRMPWTALAFPIGALSVSAIPPFNGFVSEWFTYQAFFASAQSQQFALRVLAPIFAMLLAIAGALAVMVYIKAYGGAFAGPARSQAAASAGESPFLSRLSMAYLGLGCLVLGIGSPWIAPWIANVAARVAQEPGVVVSNGWQVFPIDPTQAVLSTPLTAILLLGLLTVPLLLVAIYGGLRAGRRSGVEPWACGYGYSASMSVAPSSFDQPVKVSFHLLYWLRTLMDRPYQAMASFGRNLLQKIIRAEPVVEAVVTRPTSRLVETAGQWIQSLQMGDIRVYCLYIILTLAILLIAIFGRSGL